MSARRSIGIAPATATATATALALLVAGCGSTAREEKEAKADARAAGFVPPAVTSRVDFSSQMERRFRALDRNGDDYIVPTEWPRIGARMVELDTDKDGKVSAIEWNEGMMRRFDAMDLNRDGTVTSEEQNSWRAARAAGRTLPAPDAAPVPGAVVNSAAP